MNNFIEKLKAMSPEKRLYLLMELPTHLEKSGQIGRLQRILGLFDFLDAKLEITEPNALIADFDLIKTDPDLCAVQEALRLSAHILAVDKTQLAAQLIGRLSAYRNSTESLSNHSNSLLDSLNFIAPADCSTRNKQRNCLFVRGGYIPSYMMKFFYLSRALFNEYLEGLNKLHRSNLSRPRLVKSSLF